MKTRELTPPDAWMKTVTTLSEALPYMRQFAGETFVVKYGGNAMGDGPVSKQFAQDIVLLKQVGINPIVVHGGGPQIGKMLDRLQIESSFIDGLRVTDSAAMEVVEMVLSGSINKQIVSEINAAGGMAIGISGKDGNLIRAQKLLRMRKDASGKQVPLDLGFVGEPIGIDATLLQEFAESNIIPVIAPIGVGDAGETYNINADTVAGALAASIAACKLMILTDVAGVLDKNKQLISEITLEEAQQLIENGTVSGGMIPKLETCMHAVQNDVGAAHILDGRLPHVLLLETFTTYGAGTMICA